MLTLWSRVVSRPCTSGRRLFECGARPCRRVVRRGGSLPGMRRTQGGI
jgi:hypothetical protein